VRKVFFATVTLRPEGCYLLTLKDKPVLALVSGAYHH
jgi:hypothetical protein